MAMSRVISIDGGGVRGVVPVIVLQRLTQEPGLGDLLATTDLFAGTSTGGLIALALPPISGLPAILDLYEQRAPTIFHKTLAPPDPRPRQPHRRHLPAGEPPGPAPRGVR